MQARNLLKKFRLDIVWKRKKWGKGGSSSIAPNFESTLGFLSFDFDAQPDMYQDRRNVRGSKNWSSPYILRQINHIKIVFTKIFNISADWMLTLVQVDINS